MAEQRSGWQATNAGTEASRFWRLIDIGIALSAERNVSRLFERILNEAQAITQADGGTLYLLKEQEGQLVLQFEILRNNSLGVVMGGTSGNPVTLEPMHLYDQVSGEPNHHNVATHTALTKRLVNIPDAYDLHDEFDFSGTQHFDEQNGYRSQSFLTVPLVNHDDEVIGVIQLINAKHQHTGETMAFDRAIEPIVSALASLAAVALDNQILLQDHKDLLDAFIKVIAQAIDAKSSHTSAHCQRVPVLTELIAQAACDEREGPLANFALDDAGWYELRVASWMHDCGKLATPDSVLDKATKLHLMQDGIETVKARFAALIFSLERDAWKRCVALPEQSDAIQSALQVERVALMADRDFIVRINVGGEFMSDADKARVHQIAVREWFDSEGEKHPLLSAFEVDNLCIERGTLSHKEREIINNHMAVTIQMLESLPFPKNLRKVPEYAGGHHEKMDGSGFPRGLCRDEMSWPARMMAVADIFEALTASERPYKPPMKISQALSILRRMSEQQHIDPDLYRLFVEKRVWETYARMHLRADQLDVVEVSQYL